MQKRIKRITTDKNRISVEIVYKSMTYEKTDIRNG